MSEEYIFSFSREAMLKRCLREYYLHAFYAYGEYDVESADRKRNHVHLLKQLKSESLFVESILSDSIRKIFVDGMTINEFRRSVMNKFFFAKDDMLLGGYEYSHDWNRGSAATPCPSWLGNPSIHGAPLPWTCPGSSHPQVSLH
ncbi:MAG: hypothetical protein IKA22_06890, partial [Lentisphaeria bacterium]|nr:hypothetical protein [Lentisphaeria bacterium]